MMNVFGTDYRYMELIVLSANTREVFSNCMSLLKGRKIEICAPFLTDGSSFSSGQELNNTQSGMYFPFKS